jgi:hypothetical protein
MPIDAIADCATRVARERFGAEVAVSNATVVATRTRSVVVRCELAPHPAAPRSLIAKQHTSDDARGFSDWAGLAFLSSLAAAHGVAPRFFGGDPAARIYVMEDLGRAGTIADAVAAGDAEALRGALRSLAVTMARMVAATAGPTLELRYEQTRGDLPGGEESNRHEEAKRWRAAWPRVAAWFDALGCPLDGEVEQAFNRVFDIYAEPGPFLAYSHGDPAPSNNHIGPDAARLLDFEYGAYRHALYDITGWYVLCPLPEAWAAEMHATFRHHLAGSWAPATDEATYRADWATICAYRALAMMSWLPLDILEADRPWAEGWTMRGALLTAATRLGRATEGVTGLTALSEAGDRLAAAARTCWLELGAGLPPWPGDGVS